MVAPMDFPERLTSITELAKSFAASALKPGDIALDCTAGNGHDTLFLLERTAPDGFVYAFDIQEQALVHTARRLCEAGVVKSRFALINACHSRLEEYVKPAISACMFNLGYLPGASHSVTTEPKRVIPAIESAGRLLKPFGVITVVMYSGHEAGRDELRALLDYASTIDERAFRVIHLSNMNTSKPSPSILVLQRL